ncbi:MAG: response regulator transcription factor [candidate division Zixibacteria bacterium]|nr:response regulator transcription factor [candidate division Zixibacteria bacterium]
MNETTIVIVDDHEIFRQGLAELLIKHDGFRVVGQAGNGRQAIEIVSTTKPDIIFLDISMPELDGLSAIGQIKKARADSKIIVLTMHDKSEFVYRALSGGASGYLLKEAGAETLFEAVQEVKQGRTYLCDRINQVVIREYADAKNGTHYKSAIDGLSEREREVFQLLVEGKTGKEVAGKLNISPKTVEHHRSRILEKLQCHGIAQLIHFASKEGLI